MLFSTGIMIGIRSSYLGHMTNLVTGSWPTNNVIFGFQLMEWALHTIRKWLVTPQQYWTSKQTLPDRSVLPHT